MEVRRTLKRKALSDCTNTVATATTTTATATATAPHQPSSAKPPFTRASRKPLSSRNSDENSFKYDTSTGSNNAENPRICNQLSTPPRPKAPANSVDVGCERSGVATVYSRRQVADKTRNKGKSIAAIEPFSCPPAGRSKTVGFQLDKENTDVNVSKSCTVPHPKTKKRRRFSSPLPQEFIDKQNAYFAEIDAFELQEEVVSEHEVD